MSYPVFVYQTLTVSTLYSLHVTSGFNGESMEFRIREFWISSSGSNCVTLGKLCNLSELLFTL